MNSTIKYDIKDLLLLSCVYTLSWLFLLLNTNGIYWDDWTLIDQLPETILDTFGMVGNPFRGQVNVFLLGFGNSVFSFRLVSFASYWLVSISAYLILRSTDVFTPRQALVIAMLVAVFPVNQARVALIYTGAGYSLAFFFVAFTLAVCFSRFLVCRIIALVLFSLSFLSQSLVLFYLVPMFVLLYNERALWLRQSVFVSLRNLFQWSIKYLDFFLLPIVFFVCKLLFFKSSGLYNQYNVVNFSSLIEAIPTTLFAVGSLTWLPIYRLYDGYPLLLMVGAAFCFSCLIICSWVFRTKAIKYFYLLLIGGVVLCLAFYPYMVVQKVPLHTDWASRHQLLMPIGGSLIIFSLTMLFLKHQYRQYLFGLLIILSIGINTNDMINYHIDSIKQDAIVYGLKGMDNIKNAPHEIVVFKDETKQLNAMNRNYRFYEFNGLLKSAFGDTTRLGVDHEEPKPLATIIELKEHRHFNFSEFNSTKTKPFGTVIVSHNKSAQLGIINKLHLIYKKLFMPKEYKLVLKNFIDLKFIPAK